MKTTLAILGIFAAAVLATTFAVNAYAISQTNNVNQEQEQKNTQSASANQAGFANTVKNSNYQNQAAKQIVKNTAGLCHFC